MQFSRFPVAVAAALLALSGHSLATTISFGSSAVSSFTLGASSDSLSLNAGSGTFNSSSGSFALQTGNLLIGDSEISDQAIFFSFADTVTVNGVTQTLDVSGEDYVTTSVDTLSIFAGTPVRFGNEVLTLQAFTASGASIGQDVSVNLEASVQPALTPEPRSLVLLGTGMVGPLILRRKRPSPATRLESVKSDTSAPGMLDKS